MSPELVRERSQRHGQRLGWPLSLPQLQPDAEPGTKSHGTASDHPPAQAAQGQSQELRLRQVSQQIIVREVRSVQSADNSRLDESACSAVKNIGKPCAGEPHARFDEGGLVKTATARLFRHRQTKETETDKLNLKPLRPALYSTRNSSGIPLSPEFLVSPEFFSCGIP